MVEQSAQADKGTWYENQAAELEDVSNAGRHILGPYAWTILHGWVFLYSKFDSDISVNTLNFR